MVVYRLETRKRGLGPYHRRKWFKPQMSDDLREHVGDRVFGSVSLEEAQEWVGYFFRSTLKCYVISVYKVDDCYVEHEPRIGAGVGGRYNEVVFDRKFAKKIKEIPI